MFKLAKIRAKKEWEKKTKAIHQAVPGTCPHPDWNKPSQNLKNVWVKCNFDLSSLFFFLKGKRDVCVYWWEIKTK